MSSNLLTMPWIVGLAWFALRTPVATVQVDSRKLADAYVAAVEVVNEEHARKPTVDDESLLAAKLPKAAAAKVGELIEARDEHAAESLARAAEAALDLDRIDDFDKLRAELAKRDAERAKKLGIAISKPRYLLRGTDGVERAGLERLSEVLDLVLDAYADVFGFQSWSKLPGKKLRVRAHLVERIDRPPHFAPQFPWHSEIDFPVVDAGDFRSPTADGKFQFYGLCHELGHVIAMWGDTQNEEDRHAWAHYTGVVIVEHLSKGSRRKALDGLDDVRWRSLELERKRLADAKVEPGRKDRDSVLALLCALHELVGPRAIGDALIALERADELERVNRVRYYRLDALAKALGRAKGASKHAAKLRELFD